jgi:hypothetical protein
MAHFFAPDGNQDNFDDIGLYAPDSVSKARVKLGTSFDVGLWGGTDLTVKAEPLASSGVAPQYGVFLEELPPTGGIRKFRCYCRRMGTHRIQTYTSWFFGSQSVWLDVVVGDGSMTKLQFTRFLTLRAGWVAYRAAVTPVTAQYDQLRNDLYQVRNAGWNGNPPISVWPANLVDPDDGMMASVEHYFLCRAWVGNGVFNASQMIVQNDVYDLGKELGLTPAHNPNKPTTPLTDLQVYAQSTGVRDGETDLAASGKPAPGLKKPPIYY